MARVIREEFQDKDGNVHYLHTEDSVVWCHDGRSLRETMESVQFEDYEAEEAELPDAETALMSIRKGRGWTELFGNIKAFCKGVVLLSKVLDSENITEDGYLMSGRKCSELFQALNTKIVNISTFEQRLIAVEKTQANYASGPQTGTVPFGLMRAGTSQQATVVFPKLFTKTPTITVTLSTDNDATKYLSYTISGKTASSFVLTVKNTDSAAGCWGVVATWRASV